MMNASARPWPNQIRINLRLMTALHREIDSLGDDLQVMRWSPGMPIIKYVSVFIFRLPFSGSVMK